MGVDLSGLATKKKANGKGKDFPCFDADDEMKEQADELARLFDQEAAAAAGKVAIQADFKSKVRPFIFDNSHGKATPTTTVSVQGNESEIIVTLKDAYLGLDSLDEIKLILGEERAHKYFPQIFDLKIDSKLIPEDSQQAIIDKIAALLGEYGCSDALSAKSGFKPNKQFASARHTELTAEENLALEGIPLTVLSVAPARGRK
jgi:hypothetical protein